MSQCCTFSLVYFDPLTHCVATFAMKINMELENFTQAHKKISSNSPASNIQIASGTSQEDRPSTIFTIEEDEISNIDKPNQNVRQSRRHSCPKNSQRGRNRIRFSSFDASSSGINNANPRNEVSAALQPCNSAAIFNIENEISRIDFNINDLTQSRRRHSCPYDLKNQSEIVNQQTFDDDEININANKEWNQSQEIAFIILCTFSVVVGIALLIILIVLKFL